MYKYVKSVHHYIIDILWEGFNLFTKKTLMLTAGLCLLIGAVSFITALKNFTEVPAKKINEEENTSDITLDEYGNSESSSDNKSNVTEELNKPEEAVQTVTEQKITPSTKIIYQYYYPDDNITEQQEDVPPYFLLDLTLNDLKKYYIDWQIVSFSDREVIMRKIVEGKSQQRYIVGEQDGYVAVFYEEEINGINLHEVTDTPISSLSKEEQVRLNDGIFVLGDSELAKVLEDYGS